MRPLLAAVMVVAVLGGLQIYMQARKHFGRPPAVIVQRPADGVFDLQLTLSFDAGAGQPDPFALRVEEDSQRVLLVTFRGQTLLETTDPIEAGETITIKNIERVVAGETAFEGRNDLYVRVRPQSLDEKHPHAVHVRVMRDEVEIAEATLWSEPHQIVAGTVVFEIVESIAPAHENHH